MAIGWMIACIVLFVILFVAALCKVAGGAAEVEAPRPVTTAICEEDMIHPQEPTRWIATVTDDDVHKSAQTVWGEARGIESRMEQAAVVWCFLNRVDAWGDSLGKIVTAPNQFVGYSPENPTVDDFGRDLEELVRDVVDRWEREHNGETDVGRVLPADYLWFGGARDGHNHFRSSYDSFDDLWDWSLPDPYEGR